MEQLRSVRPQPQTIPVNESLSSAITRGPPSISPQLPPITPQLLDELRIFILGILPDKLVRPARPAYLDEHLPPRKRARHTPSALEKKGEGTMKASPR
jgi:hypothetical protein